MLEPDIHQDTLQRIRNASAVQLAELYEMCLAVGQQRFQRKPPAAKPPPPAQPPQPKPDT